MSALDSLTLTSIPPEDAGRAEGKVVKHDTMIRKNLVGLGYEL